MLAPKYFRFDSYSAFAVWLLISRMVQIFLVPFVLVSQNLQDKHAEIRAENN